MGGWFLVGSPNTLVVVTVLRILGLITNGTLDGRHGVVAAGSLLYAITFQPVASCSLRVALYVLEAQEGDTDAMGAKTSDTSKPIRRL